MRLPSPLLQALTLSLMAMAVVSVFSLVAAAQPTAAPGVMAAAHASRTQAPDAATTFRASAVAPERLGNKLLAPVVVCERRDSLRSFIASGRASRAGRMSNLSTSAYYGPALDRRSDRYDL